MQLGNKSMTTVDLFRVNLKQLPSLYMTLVAWRRPNFLLCRRRSFQQPKRNMAGKLRCSVARVAA